MSDLPIMSSGAAVSSDLWVSREAWAFLWAVLIFSGLACAGGSADRLPSAVSETQLFTIDSLIDATGMLDDETRFDWTVTKNGSTTDTSLRKGQIIAAMVYSDTELSSGGAIRQVKNTVGDSSSQSSKAFNIESEKVLTYTGLSGSHLTGYEQLSLSIDGNYSSDSSNSTKCVLMSSESSSVPAFSNQVSADSALINLNSGQVSTKSQLRAIGSSSTSSGLSYQLAVTPDEEKSVYADGIVRTAFAGSIAEARVGKSSSKSKKSSSISDDWKEEAATNTWKDETQVAGDIAALQKTFGYQSGMKL